MKHKKLFAFMIIVSTLLVCCTMSISASDIWNGEEEEAYIIEGSEFTALNQNWEVAFNTSEGYKAYIYVNKIKMYIQEKVDENIYLIATENNELEVDIQEYEVYISTQLYHYWYEEEGWFPTIGLIKKGGGAKEVFNVATDVTSEVAFGFFEAFWNNGLTFWGWLIAISFGLITTFNIIKMISNSL